MVRVSAVALAVVSALIFGNQPSLVAGDCFSSEEVEVEEETVQFTCPAGYTRAPDAEKCFKVVTDRLNFDAGQARCRQDNGHLAFIESQAQSELAKQLIRAQPIQVKSDEGYWTGGRRRESDSCSSFTWRDANGEQHPVTYTNWHAGEPNNCGVNNQEICIELRNDEDFDFNDTGCTEAYPIICQYP